MNFHPNSHTVTSKEIAELQKSGFVFYVDSGAEEVFINQYFPNFNLKQLLNEIDVVLKPLCTAAIYKQLFLKNLIKPELTIHYFTANYKEEDGLAFSRIFTIENQKPVVYHELFKLPVDKRGQGISKVVFKSLLQQYINMGVSKINVHAALTDGGYVWAKHFLAATQKDEVVEILATAKQKLNAFEFSMVKRIFDNYYNTYPAGADFPINKWAEIPFMKEILRGSSWHGIMDLNKSEQLNNFISYDFR